MGCIYECREGLVFTRDRKGYERVYRCSCPLGDSHSQPMYAPTDKEKARPFYLPVFGVKRPQSTVGIEKSLPPEADA